MAKFVTISVSPELHERLGTIRREARRRHWPPQAVNVSRICSKSLEYQADRLEKLLQNGQNTARKRVV